MPYVRGFCFVIGVFMVCAAQADTIPTLAATSGSIYLSPPAVNSPYGDVSGPDFVLHSPVAAPFLLPPIPCSVPFPAGGCLGPGPSIFLQAGPQYGLASGDVTLADATYRVYYEGNAQIQYLTPTIEYPAPNPNGFSEVTIPVILSGSEKACLVPPNPQFGTCSDYFGTPGYPDYIANIAINLPGTLILYGNGGPLGNQLSGAVFQSTPVPEPGGIALASLGFLLLSMGCRAYKRRTLL